MNYVSQIQAFMPSTQEEERAKAEILQKIGEQGNDLLYRDAPAHFTSSALILNPIWTKTLLIFHRQFQSWTYPGGHADGDEDLLGAALREAKEETGLSNVAPLSGEILSLDLLKVPESWRAGRLVPAHIHLSASFVLLAREEEPLHANLAETGGLCWTPVEKLDERCREAHMRAIFYKLLARAEGLCSKEERK